MYIILVIHIDYTDGCPSASEQFVFYRIVMVLRP
jgi:hypothetical protein